MTTTVDGLQLRDNHSFLHHRLKHLLKYHNGHVKNLVQELHREHDKCTVGTWSLRHNWKTNCWNLSLMNTGTSTTEDEEHEEVFSSSASSSSSSSPSSF